MTKAAPAPTFSLETLSQPIVPSVYFSLFRGPISDNGATPWTATLGLGTPGQNLKFMLDTGTLNTWITAKSCTTDACKKHKAFDPDASITYVPSGQPPKSVSFGPWGNMEVVLGSDVCHLQLDQYGTSRTVGLNEVMSIYLATNYDGPQFAALDCDGGLAIPSIPSDQPSALLEQLKAQGLIEYAIASFYFDPVRGFGVCRMGSVDMNLFEPSTFNVLPLQPLSGDLNYLWNVPLDNLTIGGASVTQNAGLVLDTGSSRFKGGQAVIQRMLNAITDNGARPTQVDNAAALANYPSLTLTMGGVNYTLTPQQYFLKLSDTLWEVGVHYLEGLPDEMLLVGSVFLDTVYSIFYYETGTPDLQAVGLATPKRPAMSVSGVWQNEFGSTLEIGAVSSDGTFQGSYSSDTGATGVYPVMGVADPDPAGESLAVSFSVTWRSLEGPSDPSWHWVSGFTGLLQTKNGAESMGTIYLLQQNVTDQTADWMATATYPSTFHRKYS